MQWGLGLPSAHVPFLESTMAGATGVTWGITAGVTLGVTTGVTLNHINPQK